jgi:hypothetical protein
MPKSLNNLLFVSRRAAAESSALAAAKRSFKEQLQKWFIVIKPF